MSGNDRRGCLSRQQPLHVGVGVERRQVSRAPRPRRRRRSARSSRSAMATATPPLAVPSSLVSTMPVTPDLAAEGLGLERPFCPVVASSTSSTWRGWPGSRRSMTLRILRQLGHQLDLVLQPAGRVDDHRLDAPRLGGGHRVEGDRAGIRAGALGDRPAPRAARPTGAAARSPPRGRCRPRPGPRCGRRAASRPASLAMVVVLPVPLTPTTRITDGAGPSSNGRATWPAAARGSSSARLCARPRRWRTPDALLRRGDQRQPSFRDRRRRQSAPPPARPRSPQRRPIRDPAGHAAGAPRPPGRGPQAEARRLAPGRAIIRPPPRPERRPGAG